MPPCTLGSLAVGILILAQTTHIQGLTCIDCADFVINGSALGSVVSPILNAIPGIRQKNCRSATYQTSGIKKTTCPKDPVSVDKAYRCGAYMGRINVVGPLNLFDIPVHIIDRECVLVYKGLRNGCHPQDYVQQDAATFQKVLEKLDNIPGGVVSFAGSLCLSSDDSTSGTSRLSATCGPLSLLLLILYASFT